MLRGWNPVFAALFTPDFHEQGIPIKPSTTETLGVARSLLHKMGSSALLLKTVSMMKAGLTDVTEVSDAIHVQSLDFSGDLFMDQTEVDRLAKIEREMGDPETRLPLSSDEIREKMSSLVFPFDTPYGRMVGYGGDPALDEHFLAVVMETMEDWRTHAGIHPDVEVDGFSGGVLTGIVSLLASIRLKHINFVSAGRSVLENVNYAMSLTI